jgi:hypothetical protein
LYRFVGYVEWPAGAKANEAIVIGMLSADAIGVELQRIAQERKAQGRPVVVRHVEGAGDMIGIHVLFIGAQENARLSKLISSVRHLPILVVTEAPDGLERGSMINFVTTDRVQFEVAVDNATTAGIHLNSRLLSVAVRVRKGQLLSDDTLLAGESSLRHSAFLDISQARFTDWLPVASVLLSHLSDRKPT